MSKRKKQAVPQPVRTPNLGVDAMRHSIHTPESMVAYFKEREQAAGPGYDSQRGLDTQSRQDGLRKRLECLILEAETTINSVANEFDAQDDFLAFSQAVLSFYVERECMGEYAETICQMSEEQRARVLDAMTLDRERRCLKREIESGNALAAAVYSIAFGISLARLTEFRPVERYVGDKLNRAPATARKAKAKRSPKHTTIW